jgi:hypothetical protein
MSSILNMSLDDLYSSLNIGSIERANANNLYGLNHRAIPTVVPSNKDRYGLTFFVRPQLNMTQDNIRNIRSFYSLLNDNQFSIQRYVRCMLDPRLAEGIVIGTRTYPKIDTGLVDRSNPFIPILTNNLLSISGWPDLTSPTFSSQPGLYKEVYSQVDGLVRNFESFDLDATFRNVRNDPIIMMFYIWCHYQSYVFEGKLMPYFDFLLENEIDYNTRIYRLILDSTFTHVTKIAATGAAFPISVNLSSFFDYNNEKPFNDQSKEINVRFRCMGAEYLDDVLIYEFNETVCIFNSDMKDNRRGSSMVRINSSILTLFNNRGYPRINYNTYELEWYVPKDMYNSYTRKFLATAATNVTDNEEFGD